MMVLSIVWSPRRIDEALRSHERLAEVYDWLDVCFITGYTEHEGCAAANRVIRENDAYDLVLLSYDDQVVTPEHLQLVLRWAAETGDVVSGWQVLGQDSPYGAATKPTWGHQPLALNDDCFYRVEDLRNPYALGGDELVPSLYFATMTLVPREWMLECPLRALPSVVSGSHLETWPSRTGEPYDKGCCSDWTLAVDLDTMGHRIWIARQAEVRHLAPRHGVPAHKFWMAEDPQGVHWDHRPR